jgi:hypothetical protein
MTDSQRLANLEGQVSILKAVVIANLGLTASVLAAVVLKN